MDTLRAEAPDKTDDPEEARRKFGVWQEASLRALKAMLDRVRGCLESPSSGTKTAHKATDASGIAIQGTALQNLCNAFALTSFERDILLLCAGVELDGGFQKLCAERQNNPAQNYPTFNLALNVLPDAHWSALTPAAPLRRYRLIEVVGTGSAPPLTVCPLRIEEWILHYLRGVPHPDPRLPGTMLPRTPEEALLYPNASPPRIFPILEQLRAGSHQRMVTQITNLLGRDGLSTLVQLCGDALSDKIAIAQAVARNSRCQLRIVSLLELPVQRAEQETFLALWERERRLRPTLLLIEVDTPGELRDSENEGTGSAHSHPGGGRFGPLLERLPGQVLLSSERRLSLHRPSPLLTIDKLGAAEQIEVWSDALTASGFPETHQNSDARKAEIQRIVAQFHLEAGRIEAVVSQIDATAGQGSADPDTTDPSLPAPFVYCRDICRQEARTELESLAQRVQVRAAWNDLILPAPQKSLLRGIVAQIRNRWRVSHEWKMRGSELGVTALFSGPSGTGKTLAAEVIAGELDLDLFRVDLAAVVSKYIGETEKNLRRLFAAAESGGVTLLFDEADSLFGKRSEVTDSHDRHANIEVSYLLQRMESYRGLAILTTNLKSSLDIAFYRRLRFVVEFPFPDAALRASIWSRAFSPGMTEGLNMARLAQLNFSGGSIRNCAINAAFLAADENGANPKVQMIHILNAAHAECAKMERRLTEAEISGWNLETKST